MAYVSKTNLTGEELLAVLGQVKKRGKILIAAEDDKEKLREYGEVFEMQRAFVKQKHPLGGGRLLIEVRV